MECFKSSSNQGPVWVLEKEPKSWDRVWKIHMSIPFPNRPPLSHQHDASPPASLCLLLHTPPTHSNTSIPGVLLSLHQHSPSRKKNGSRTRNVVLKPLSYEVWLYKPGCNLPHSWPPVWHIMPIGTISKGRVLDLVTNEVWYGQSKRQNEDQRGFFWLILLLILFIWFDWLVYHLFTFYHAITLKTNIYLFENPGMLPVTGYSL